jgi:hypothetical protein
MRRTLSALGVLAIALSLAAPSLAAPAERPDTATHNRIAKKHSVSRHWRGYGFLPGYPLTEAERYERWEHSRRLSGSYYYGPAWPRFYRGRWNGGGFGPCWTQTPIGPMWNCGR